MKELTKQRLYKQAHALLDRAQNLLKAAYKDHLADTTNC